MKNMCVNKYLYPSHKRMTSQYDLIVPGGNSSVYSGPRDAVTEFHQLPYYDKQEGVFYSGKSCYTETGAGFLYLKMPLKADKNWKAGMLEVTALDSFMVFLSSI